MAKGTRPIVVPRRGGLVVAGHESPHKFDQFSLDHMGSGEGHQAYSKGLYFWENPRVGESYNDQFKDKLQRDNPEQRAWQKAQDAHDEWFWSDYRNRLPYNEDFASEFRSSLGLNLAKRPSDSDEISLHSWHNDFLNPEQDAKLAAIAAEVPFVDGVPRYDRGNQRLSFREHQPHNASVLNSLPYYEALGEMLTPEQRAQVRLSVDRDLWGIQRRSRREFDATMDAIRSAPPSDWARVIASKRPIQRWNIGDAVPHPGEAPPAPRPFSYHVNLHADRSDFPDLSVPIEDQPPALVGALADFADTSLRRAWGGEDLSPIDYWGSYTPSQLRMLLDNHSQFDGWDGEALPFPQAGKFEAGLVKRGIPGVRYDDYSSRPPDSASSTQNFVVYDPSIIELVKRYPYSILAPMLLGSASQGREQEAERILGPSLLSQ